MSPARIVRLALAYWAGVFAFGFALGTARVLLVAPAIGAIAAVLIEVPLMLAASWWLARRLLADCGPTAGEAAAIGALAFALLMASEALLARALGQRPGEWLAAMATVPGAIGLAGQLGFAAIPTLARRTG